MVDPGSIVWPRYDLAGASALLRRYVRRPSRSASFPLLCVLRNTPRVLRNVSRRDAALTMTELRRYKLPASSSGNASVHALRLVDGTGRVSQLAELPTINPASSGRRACFAYLFCPQYGGDLRWSSIALVKKNLCNESAPVVSWQREGHFPGEATFVARPSQPTVTTVEEDDGVLLAATHDATAGAETYLLVLNATTMGTLAEVRLPAGAAGKESGTGCSWPAPSGSVHGALHQGSRRLHAFGIHGTFWPASTQRHE
jgi:hypothetical protein